MNLSTVNLSRVVLGAIHTARHLYNVGVSKDGVTSTIEVHAGTRAAARIIAERAGYVVRDVNMVG